MLSSYVAIGLLSTSVLLLLCFLIKNNKYFDNKKKIVFLITNAATITIILAELCTSYCDIKGTPDLYILNNIGNVIGFSLSSFIPLLLSILIKPDFLNQFILPFAPAFLNFIFSLLSPFINLIFSVSSENVYSRGPLFLFYVFSYMWGIAVFVKVVFSVSKHYPENPVFLFLLTIFTLGGTTFQLISPNIHTTWICVTFALIIYYAFICSFGDQHDVLTSLFNRRSYEVAKDYYKNINNVAVIVIDVDGFKSINDTYGHLYGDECLTIIGSYINEIFSDSATPFRFGGDEFCILYQINKEEELKQKINALEVLIDDYRAKDINFPTVSIGYEIYTKNIDNSIDEVFKEADRKLYENKKIKQ